LKNNLSYMSRKYTHTHILLGFISKATKGKSGGEAALNPVLSHLRSKQFGQGLLGYGHVVM